MPKRNKDSALGIGDFQVKIQRNEKTLSPGTANDHVRGQRSLGYLRADRIRLHRAWMDFRKFSKIWHNKSLCRKASLRITRQT